MKKYLLVFLLSVSALRVNASDRIIAQPFDPDQVHLLPSRFLDNMRRDSAWIMSIPVSSLLHSFQTTAGVYAGKEGGYMTVRKLAGWESLDCELRGHITGHLLSALATLYAQTQSVVVKAKADSIVGGLREVQSAMHTGYLSAFPEGLIDRNIAGKSVWAPWYTLHKIAQGLIDQYRLCGNDTALAIVRGMGNWAYKKLKPIDEATRRRMLRNEFGGFNEAMYELYAVTGDERYHWIANFFYDKTKIDPLKAGNDDLGTNHANTFIPKVLGEARNYELSGDASSRKAAELLFATLTRKHAFVTGEVSDKEHLFAPDLQSKHISGYDGENCCTFNLLKLADHVFSWNVDSRIADYYERALYNHILGQQDPETGMVSYFTPLKTGTYRLYSTRDSSYWCCVGSGFESHVKYASSIYFHDDNTLWVNLFIPSTLKWGETGLSLNTSFPESGRVTLRMSGKLRAFALKLRHPSWATAMVVRVNGRKQSLPTDGKGYVTVRRNWKAGDEVTVDYGMSLHEEATHDDPSQYAILYGPVVLGGELEAVARPFSDPKQYNDYYTFNYDIPSAAAEKGRLNGHQQLCRTDNNPLHYSAPNGMRLLPFYDIHHHRYVVYWHR
jgi:DUF1680 family protein